MRHLAITLDSRRNAFGRQGNWKTGASWGKETHDNAPGPEWVHIITLFLQLCLNYVPPSSNTISRLSSKWHVLTRHYIRYCLIHKIVWLNRVLSSELAADRSPEWLRLPILSDTMLGLVTAVVCWLATLGATNRR